MVAEPANLAPKAPIGSLAFRRKAARVSWMSAVGTFVLVTICSRLGLDSLAYMIVVVLTFVPFPFMAGFLALPDSGKSITYEKGITIPALIGIALSTLVMYVYVSHLTP